jgi:hypothetical protein
MEKSDTAKWAKRPLGLRPHRISVTPERNYAYLLTLQSGHESRELSGVEFGTEDPRNDRRGKFSKALSSL